MAAVPPGGGPGFGISGGVNFGISGGVNFGGGGGVGVRVGPGGIGISGGVGIGGANIGISGGLGPGGFGLSGRIGIGGVGLSISAGGFMPALILPRRRSIGGIMAQVTIEVQHTDEVQITDHPIEQGAPISDHAFKRPISVNINAGWSTAWAYDLSAETGIYGLLLALQASFLPFDLVTGKRTYPNMLIERLIVTTDQHSEFALMAQIGCRQVIIVKTSTTSVSKTASDDPNAHKDGGTTPDKPQGDKPTTPLPTGDNTVSGDNTANSTAGDAVQRQADRDDSGAMEDGGKGNLDSKGIILGGPQGSSAF
jgi:hypothetical protein